MKILLPKIKLEAIWDAWKISWKLLFIHVYLRRDISIQRNWLILFSSPPISMKITRIENHLQCNILEYINTNRSVSTSLSIFSDTAWKILLIP